MHNLTYVSVKAMFQFKAILAPVMMRPSTSMSQSTTYYIVVSQHTKWYRTTNFTPKGEDHFILLTLKSLSQGKLS